MLKRAKLEGADEISELISNISETPGAMRRLSSLYTAADRDLKSNIAFTKEAGLRGVLGADLAILSGNKNYIDEQYIRSFADMWAKSAEKSNAWVLEKSGMSEKDFSDALSNYVLGNEDLPAGGMRRIADGMKAAIANHAAFLSENSGDGFFAAQAESLKQSVPLALAVLETGSERVALINRNLNDYTGGTYYDYGRRNYGNSDYAEGTSDNRTALYGEQGTEHGFGRDFESGQRGVRQAVQRTYTEGERRSFKDGNGNEISYTEVEALDENSKAIADYTKLFGYDCQFVKGLNADGYPLNGMRRGKTIYLDIENESIKQTQGHELLHAIKQKVGGGYAELRSKSVSFIGMEKFGIIRDRYIDLYRELYSKNSFDEMTDAERADMWDMIDEEIMADIVGFVRDGDTESLMDIFGYSIESVSDILDTVNAILDEGRKGAPTESDNAVNYQAESDNDVIELSHDNELSKRIEGLRGAAKYKAITDYILEALSEQPITMSDGTKVIVNKRDVKHIAHNSGEKKIGYISEIKRLVENAKLFAIDENPDHTNYKLFKYYAANVRYDGQEYPIYLNVGESRNGSGYHLYDITKKIRETAHRINGVGRVNYDLRPENGFSTNNIPQNSGNVNTNVRKNSKNITENSENGKNNTRFQAKDNAAITDRDIKAVQSVGRKSVNDFTSADIKKTESFARKYFKEMGVKSPFFRAWFGDWRANDTSTVSVADKKGSVRGVTKNLDTGWDINVSGKVFNETKSHNSGHAKEALVYLDYINSIVENAVLLDSYTVPSGKAKSANSAMMHSLYAIADMGNGRELIKLYVEELNDVNSDGTIKRAYQLQNIAKAPAASVRVQNNILSSLTNTASADTYSVSQLFDLVKQNDKNFNPKPASKVVNDDGTPKVVYHGTSKKFFEFRKGEKNGWLGKGIYLTSNREYAKENGKRVMPLYVYAKNPFIANGGDAFAVLSTVKEKFPETNDLDIAETLQENGYDGIIFKHWDKGEIISVFSPNQIKSATDNIGTFDTANDDIRFQASGIISYTEKEKDNWKKSHSIIIYESDNQFENFVDRVLENKDTEKKIYFGKISPSTAKFVLNKTGVDIENLNIALKGYEIRKILLNSHGDVKKENLRGQDIITIDDLKKIPFVVANPDNVTLSSKQYEGKPVILFEKSFNGKNYIVAYVSRKHHDMAIQTMYKNRSLSTAKNADALFLTPETTSSTASTNIISQEVQNVNIIKKDDVSFKSKSETADNSNPLGETSSTNIISQKAQKVKTENTKYQRGRAAKYDTRTVEEKEIDRLKHEVERLSKKNEYLKAETKVSADGTRRVEGLWLKLITEDLIGATGAELTKRYIAKQLREGYERMLNKPQGEGMTREEAKPFYDLALEIMENTYTDEGERFREFVSKLDIGIDPKHAPDILGERGKEAVKEAHRRGMKIKKGVGVPYQFDADLPELRDYYPEFVTEEDLDSPWQNFAMKAADWIKSRDDILKSNYSYANEGIVRNETGMSVDEFRFELAKQMIDYARIGGIKQYKTLADKLKDAKAEIKNSETARAKEQKQSEKTIRALTKENTRLKEAADIIAKNMQLTRAGEKRIADGALRKIVKGFKKMADSTVKTGEFGDIVKELFSAVINREENGMTDAEISAIAKKAASKLIGGTELNGAEAEQQIEVYENIS